MSPKRPDQQPIVVEYSPDTKVRTVKGVQVPPPPTGCESQQLMDWCAIHGPMGRPDVGLDLKIRVVEAYAKRWGIEIREVHPDG